MEAREGQESDGEKQNLAGQQGRQENSSQGISWKKQKMDASLVVRSTDGLLTKGT